MGNRRRERETELYREIDRQIAERGYHLLGVFPTRDAPDTVGWVYTLGLSERGHPELLIVGLPPDSAQGIIGVLAARVAGGETLPIGERIDEVLKGGFQVLLRAVPPAALPSDLFNMGRGYRRARGQPPDVPALQVLWPDKENRLPGEAGCDAKLAALQDGSRTDTGVRLDARPN